MRLLRAFLALPVLLSLSACFEVTSVTSVDKDGNATSHSQIVTSVVTAAMFDDFVQGLRRKGIRPTIQTDQDGNVKIAWTERGFAFGGQWKCGGLFTTKCNYSLATNMTSDDFHADLFAQSVKAQSAKKGKQATLPHWRLIVILPETAKVTEHNAADTYVDADGQNLEWSGTAIPGEALNINFQAKL